MKIKSPLTAKEEVKPLCDAGADEFFCGIEPSDWRRKYKDFSINQRTGGANFSKLKDLEKAISIAHKHKTKVHIAVNAFFYLEEQYEMAEGIVKDVFNIGADGLILADPILLLNIDKGLLKHKDVVIGCDATIFNSAASKFYKDLGATRLVFPRAMTIEEIKEVVISYRAIEYEVFIIHDLCFFVDGFCSYCKEGSGGIKKEGRGRKGLYVFTSSRLPMRGYGGGCRTSFARHRFSLLGDKKYKSAKRFNFWGKKHIQGCGACSIYDLKRIGLDSLKVLDRNLPTQEKVRATGFIKKASDFLKNNNISKKDYIAKCRDLFKETFKVKCSQYDCYYPDANIRECNANECEF